MPQQPPVRSTPPRRTPSDAAANTVDVAHAAHSMDLLTNVMAHSLDDGYAQAAARRGVPGPRGLPRTPRRRLFLAAGFVLAALVVTVGAAQARVTAPREAKERQGLIDRITEDTAAADRLESRVDALRGEVRARQREALKASGKGQESLVELLSGATVVHGPGVQLMVDDAESADQNGGNGGPRESAGFSDTGRVRDRDLQRVVNGLWASGAEAVSINGQRLTALSAIRAAGDAILVDNRPLVPPYEVLAVGDGRRLSTRFQNGPDGQYLHALQDDFGIRAGISVRDDIRLPEAPSLIVRTAEPAVPTPHSTQAAQSASKTQKGTS